MMKKERVLEAITAHDPDGNAINRVRAAAEATLATTNSHYKSRFIAGEQPPGTCLIKASNCSCLLAHAWDAYEVGYDEFFRNSATPHNYRDVVEWFDNLKNNKEASRRILAILND